MNARFKFIFVFIIFISLTVWGQENNSSNDVSGNLPVSPSWIDRHSKIQADSIAPDQTGMRDISSFQLSKEMSPGWNVGNSLDAIGGETAWGNPKITQRLIDSIKAAGFKCVRIPVAWSKFIDDSTFTIDPSWLDRVEEVVNSVLNDDMYAIINEHWDGGWQQPTYKQQDYVNKRLAAMWEQIAVRFRDYDDHLLFAGTNEIMVTNNYNPPTKEYYTVQNGFNQVFVNTVRSTGGRNYYRFLLVQGFNTNIDNTINYFVMPNDVVQNKLMVEVHYYDPYNFTINASSSITQWGKNATDPKKTETWANESYADNQFNKMKTKYIDKGIGVILGEYGTMARLNLGSDALNKEYAGYRLYYMQYVTGSMARHGLVPVYWDNGGTGDHGMGIFNRSTGAKAYPDIVNAIITAVDTIQTDVKKDDGILKPTNFLLQQNFPNPFNPTTTISFSLQSRTMVKLKIFDVMGNEVVAIVSGELSPGTYTKQWNAENFSSGIYFYQLQAGANTETRKMILLK